MRMIAVTLNHNSLPIVFVRAFFEQTSSNAVVYTSLIGMFVVTDKMPAFFLSFFVSEEHRR